MTDLEKQLREQAAFWQTMAQGSTRSLEAIVEQLERSQADNNRLRAELADIKAQQAEPVAYLIEGEHARSVVLAHEVKSFQRPTLTRTPLFAAPPSPAVPEVTPAMLKAAQTKSELGEYACANLSGAYSLITELFEVMLAAQSSAVPEGRALDVARRVHATLVADGYYGPYVLGTDLWAEFDAAMAKEPT